MVDPLALVEGKIQNNNLTMASFPVTAQMVVKNEERFVWFAVVAVLPFVERFLITDTGSTDRTWSVLSSIKDPKIVLKRRRESVVTVRQRQLTQTKTPWFLLVDGDEIWPKKQLVQLLKLTKELPKGKLAVVNRTRNCVGDVWHYLPKETGRYQFGQWRGHLNIRLMRTLPYEIEGTYPWEEYRLAGESINQMAERLELTNSWLLHVTHLSRSSANGHVPLGRRKQLLETGLPIRQGDLPEVLFQNRPDDITNPLEKRSGWYEIAAQLITPLKQVKRMMRHNRYHNVT
jgi:glycosyltransferase involved in cell wall biosynthesis